MKFVCPVCGWPNLPDPPQDYEICPSCGTEFGYDDFTRSHAELRAEWMANGMAWHGAAPKPLGWNPKGQLVNVNVMAQPPTPHATNTTINGWTNPYFGIAQVIPA